MLVLDYATNLFLLFLIYSIIGWLIEVTFVSIEYKKFVNRGFLIGPYCPIYGFGGLAISLLLKKYASDYIVTLILSAVIASVLEYITSYLMEKMFKARWWDYSHRRFNLNGRICLGNCLLFGIIGTIMLCFLTPLFSKFISSIPQNIKYITSGLLAIIFIVDNIISFNIISSMKHLAFEIKKDSSMEITKKVKEILLDKNTLFRRVIHAFPNLKYTIEEKKRLLKSRRDKFILKTKQSINESRNKLEKDLQDAAARFKIKK